MFRPQPLRYLVIMQNCIIWLPAIYMHAQVRKGPVTYVCHVDPVYTKLPLQKYKCQLRLAHLYLFLLTIPPLFNITLAVT